MMVVFLLVLNFAIVRLRRLKEALPLPLSFAAIPMLWHQADGVWSHLPTMIAALTGIVLLLH